MTEAERKAEQDRINRRADPRMPVRVRVLFGRRDPVHEGFVRNVSSTGLGIASNIAYPAGTRLSLRVIRNAGADIYLVGNVVWAKPMPPDVKASLANQLGIQLQNPPKPWTDYVAELRQTFSEKRATPRFEEVVKVSFVEPSNVPAAVTRNISSRGIFVRSETAVPANTLIKFKLQLGEILDEVFVVGRVAFSRSGTDAALAGEEPGMGVEILDVVSGSQETFDAYIRSLCEKYGYKEGPTAVDAKPSA